MGVAWRLVRAHYAEKAFLGEGARLYGGRWNSPGTAIVYASAHLSLAALEILVHSQPLLPQDVFTAFRIEWPDALAHTIAVSSLSKRWTAEPAGLASTEVGDRWAKEKSSAVLIVPSVLIPEENNFLLNPQHQDYKKLKIQEVRDFGFDPRLLLS